MKLIQKHKEKFYIPGNSGWIEAPLSDRNLGLPDMNSSSFLEDKHISNLPDKFFREQNLLYIRLKEL